MFETLLCFLNHFYRFLNDISLKLLACQLLCSHITSVTLKGEFTLQLRHFTPQAANKQAYNLYLLISWRKENENV